MTVLQISGLYKHFAGLTALEAVHLDVAEGSVHAIIGPNGAGKSTLLNCLVGRIVPDAGSATFAGRSLLGIKPHEINQAGVARVFQTPEIFDDLTVLENLIIPALAKRDGQFALNGWRRLDAQADIRDHAVHVLDDVDLHNRRDDIASSLSRGDKRRLELAMCLIQEPRLLLLDEPTAGMSRADTNNTIELLRKIGEHQSHHRTRHACRVLVGPQDHCAVAGKGDCRGQSGRNQG